MDGEISPYCAAHCVPSESPERDGNPKRHRKLKNEIREKTKKVMSGFKLLGAMRVIAPSHFSPIICSTAQRKEFHVAPMRDYTDRHQRHFTRLLTKKAVLWSEMEKAHAVSNASDRKLESLLRRGHSDGYEVLQLGGNDPEEVAAATALALTFGYDSINLNCGCPAVETGGGDFGASLMREGGDNAAAVVEAMVREVGKAANHKQVPVTIKCRVGVCETIDDILGADASAEQVDEVLAEPLRKFIEKCKNAGAESFVIHARQAVMAGVTPKNNRNVPPLRYELVTEIAKEFRDTCITLNGGVGSIGESLKIIDSTKELSGIQAGRWPLYKPFDLLDIDEEFYNRTFDADINDSNALGGLLHSSNATDAIEQYVFRYAVRGLDNGEATVGALARPLLLALSDLDDRVACDDERDNMSAVVETRDFLLECVGELLDCAHGGSETKDPKRIRKALAKAVGKKVVGKQRGTRAEAAASTSSGVG